MKARIHRTLDEPFARAPFVESSSGRFAKVAESNWRVIVGLSTQAQQYHAESLVHVRHNLQQTGSGGLHLMFGSVGYVIPLRLNE